MGFLDRLRGHGPDAGVDAGRPNDPTDDLSGGGDAAEVVEGLEEIGIRRLTSEEEATLEAVRAGYPEHGIDPADLDSLATAYDRALDHADEADTSALVELLGTAIGDHLVAVGGYRWVVSTDPFGTDLAVEPPRRGVPVVTRTLVAVRWMGRDRGWIPGVVGHLARAGRG